MLKLIDSDIESQLIMNKHCKLLIYVEILHVKLNCHPIYVKFLFAFLFYKKNICLNKY